MSEYMNKIEEDQYNGIKREYTLEVLGKDKDGEEIFKISDMYIPEDPKLKKRLFHYIRKYLIKKKGKTSNKRDDKTAMPYPVSYTHLRAHETSLHLVCRLLLEKKKKKNKQIQS
eukprot:TRINITY_DN15406_c0_g1_i3.p2 TRINITY_DN15406_c0_g1~~TRINITY_DN15406_c0_g1_i3.p2  ORF type:complete len:114 (-),score=31.81 TRINITY_DN15406_c0_g1_i3:46-387(-)